MDISQALRWRRAVAAVAATAVVASVATQIDWTAPATGPAGPRLAGALQSFEACDDLLGYFRDQTIAMFDRPVWGSVADDAGVAGVPTWPPGAPTRESASATDSAAVAAPTGATPVAGVDFSATNVQEAGVDEPDLVKTDGRRLVTVAPDGQEAGLRIVDVTGAEPRLAGRLPLPTANASATLLLKGDRVIVLAPAYADVTYGEPRLQGSNTGRVPGSTVVTTVDIADPARPTVVSELTLDGSLVAARLVGGSARLVLRSGPPDLGFVYPSGTQASLRESTATNRRLVLESNIDDWLPRYTFTQPGRGASAPTTDRLVGCDAVSRPPEPSGLDMVSVLSVEVDDPRPGPAASVLGAGEIVYASARNLYVTSTVWATPTMIPTPGPGGAEPARLRSSMPRWASPGATQVHKFDIADPVRTTYLASGSVPGRLLNSFSLSEHEGDLRAAALVEGSTGASQSTVTVLRQKGAALDEVGRVEGLGKGERIYAVRFMGDRGYVVTFRQTDPLYVLDLSDPARPAVTGELKVPGYSAYLHPAGDHRLIGVGQAATDQGRIQGTQLSLFDVSDPADPKRLANATLPTFSRSEVEYDHHAFLYWPATGLTLLPIQSDERSRLVSSAAGFTVTADAITDLGRVEHEGQPARRSMVVGDQVLTLFAGGLLSSDLRTLAPGAWLSL